MHNQSRNRSRFIPRPTLVIPDSCVVQNVRISLLNSSRLPRPGMTQYKFENNAIVCEENVRHSRSNHRWLFASFKATLKPSIRPLSCYEIRIRPLFLKPSIADVVAIAIIIIWTKTRALSVLRPSVRPSSISGGGVKLSMQQQELLTERLRACQHCLTTK